jgi:hypothetical protein
MPDWRLNKSESIERFPLQAGKRSFFSAVKEAVAAV